LNYRGQVVLSGRGSINVYQSGYDDVPRLTIPSNLITIINHVNSTTFKAKLLASTLNLPNTTYYVTVDDGMVLNANLSEPLPGIKPGAWNFTTASQKTLYSEAATVLLRFGSQSQQSFLTNSSATLKEIHTEVSRFLPVEIRRISTPYSAWYYDKGTNHDHILVPIRIEPGDPSPLKLISDLEDLVFNLPSTNMANGTMTSMLDSKFGAPVQTDFWVENKTVLILAGIAVSLVILLYIAAERRDPAARNVAIPQFVLILADFALDIIFLLTHSRDVSFLFVPSMIFTTVPLSFNFFWSAGTLIREAFYHDDFLRWFKSNTAIASAFTVLGSAEVEVLSILNSRAGGIKTLQAPWSDRASKMIFIGSFIGFIIEDVPQFVIQVIYEQNTASYSIIPFLTLATASLMIVHAIVGKLYLGIARWRQSKHQYEPPGGGEAWRELMSEVERLAKEHQEESRKSIAAAKLAAKKRAEEKKDHISGGNRGTVLKGGNYKDKGKRREDERYAFEGDVSSGGSV
ncbi:235_t:CDS:2, partial [Acaulospora morrowiae]